MYSPLFSLFFCAFFSSIFRLNFVFCSPSSDLPGGLASRSSSSYSSNHPANDSSSNASYLHASTSPIPPDRSISNAYANHPSTSGRSSLPSRTVSTNSNRQTDQLILTDRTNSKPFTSNHFNNHSQYSNETVLNDRLNQKSATPAHPTNRVPTSSSKESISSRNLKQIFHTVYESNYAHFCPCPPRLKGARHSLEGAEGDKTATECIYLPLTTVQYWCTRTAKKQNSQTVDRLICDLDPITNRLGWIIDADDKLLDLDDLLLAYRDQFTDDQTGWNETMEIRAQSAQLSEFSIEFVQCNDRKLILFGF